MNHYPSRRSGVPKLRQETTEPAGIAQLVQVHGDYSAVTAVFQLA